MCALVEKKTPNRNETTISVSASQRDRLTGIVTVRTRRQESQPRPLCVNVFCKLGDGTWSPALFPCSTAEITQDGDANLPSQKCITSVRCVVGRGQQVVNRCSSAALRRHARDPSKDPGPSGPALGTHGRSPVVSSTKSSNTRSHERRGRAAAICPTFCSAPGQSHGSRLGPLKTSPDADHWSICASIFKSSCC